MKKEIFGLLLMLASVSLKAQDVIDLNYYLISGISLQECEVDGDTNNHKAKVLPKGAKFTIVGTNGNNFIIRFWTWNYNGSSKLSMNEIKSLVETLPENKKKISNGQYYYTYNVDETKPASNNLRYFIISNDYLKLFARKIIARWNATYGVAVLPFKLRPSKGDFSKDLSISNLGGAKLKLNELGTHYLSFIAGVGITSVKLDSLNTEGKLTQNQDRAALTLTTGFVYQFEKLQVGLFTGWDWLSRSSVDNWVYQGKPWVGIGIGISIFSDTNASKDVKDQATD